MRPISLSVNGNDALVSSADVFWVERCVTSQKTSAEETNDAQEKLGG